MDLADNQYDLARKHDEIIIFPQQRKLMGSSAQNSSGVHWCRRRVRFNEGSGEGSRKPWCKAKSGSTGFRRRFRRRSGRLWCRARSCSTGFGEGSGEGSWEGSGEGQGGFGAEPGQVKQGLVQSQVRLNRAPEKVPEKVPGSLGAKPSQVQRVPEKVAEKVPEKVLGIFGAGPGRVQQVQQGFQRLASQHASEMCKNKMLRLLGIPPKLIFNKEHWISWDPVFQTSAECLEVCPMWCWNESGWWRFGSSAVTWAVKHAAQSGLMVPRGLAGTAPRCELPEGNHDSI